MSDFPPEIQEIFVTERRRMPSLGDFIEAASIAAICLMLMCIGLIG